MEDDNNLQSATNIRNEIENLRTNILKKVAHLNISLPKLAEMIGMPYQSLWRITYENYYTPNLKSLYLIADFFDVTVGDLFKSPNMPQYVPLLELHQVESYINQGYTTAELNSSVLCNEYVHELAFALNITQMQYGFETTSTLILKPYSKLQNGVLILKEYTRNMLVNILTSGNEVFGIDMISNKNVKFDLKNIVVIAIAIKQIVENSLF